MPDMPAGENGAFDIGSVAYVPLRFHCEECDTFHDASANDIIQTGTPICEICDEEMELAPEGNETADGRSVCRAYLFHCDLVDAVVQLRTEWGSMKDVRLAEQNADELLERIADHVGGDPNERSQPDDDDNSGGDSKGS